MDIMENLCTYMVTRLKQLIVSSQWQIELKIKTGSCVCQNIILCPPENIYIKYTMIGNIVCQ